MKRNTKKQSLKHNNLIAASTHIDLTKAQYKSIYNLLFFSTTKENLTKKNQQLGRGNQTRTAREGLCMNKTDLDGGKEATF